MQRKTLVTVDLQPNKDPWIQGNMDTIKWTHRAGQKEEEVKNENVIAYIKKLNRGGRFNKATREAVCGHEMWNKDDEESRSREQDLEQSAPSRLVNGDSADYDANADDSDQTQEDSDEEESSSDSDYM